MHRGPLIAPLAAAAMLLAPRAHAQLVPNLGGQRAGISGFQFLKLGVGARGSAMGESFVAVADDITALHWNPAGLALFGEDGAFFSHTAYLVDIRHDFAGGVWHLDKSDAVGVSLSALHTDDMEITTETQPAGTGRYFSFGDIAVGVTYARRMASFCSVPMPAAMPCRTATSIYWSGCLKRPTRVRPPSRSGGRCVTWSCYDSWSLMQSTLAA